MQAGRLNLAMCMIKMNNWIDARNLCDKVIEEKPGNAKAYFRRGEAFIALNEHEVVILMPTRCPKKFLTVKCVEKKIIKIKQK